MNLVYTILVETQVVYQCCHLLVSMYGLAFTVNQRFKDWGVVSSTGMRHERRGHLCLLSCLCVNGTVSFCTIEYFLHSVTWGVPRLAATYAYKTIFYTFLM